MLDLFRDPMWQFIGVLFVSAVIIVAAILYLRHRPNNLRQAVIIAGAVIVAVFCLCIGITMMNFTRVAVNQDKIETVIKDFLLAMRNKDAQTAATFLSSRLKENVNASEQISTMLAGNNYVLFDGFKDISVNSFNVRTGFNSDPTEAVGTVVSIQGIVFYEDEVQGTFAVVLKEENSGWKIDSFHVTVPPSKLK